MNKPSKNKDAKDRESAPKREPDEGDVSPAGNAILDPANQTQRQDMPEEEQLTAGQPLRGSAPSKAPDNSHQPERPDHRSNQDWGSASQSGKRQGT